jgi:hypothetical protein
MENLSFLSSPSDRIVFFNVDFSVVSFMPVQRLRQIFFEVFENLTRLNFGATIKPYYGKLREVVVEVYKFY